MGLTRVIRLGMPVEDLETPVLLIVDAVHPQPRIGDPVTIIPSHICTTLNLRDVLVGVRSGRVETNWPVEARGHIW